MTPTEVDVLVVGAGPAGCVTARRSAERGLTVLLCEAGAHAADPRAGVLDIGPGSRAVERVPALLAGTRIELPRGRGPGGSGAVNGGYCLAAGRDDLPGWPATWRQHHRAGLGPALGRLRPGLHEPGPHVRWALAPFARYAVGVGQARRAGRRVTAWDAWDPEGAGVRVRLGEEVVALRWAGGRVAGRCTGVVTVDGREITARRVVLCAGSLGTVRLLRASGLGPATGHAVGLGMTEHPELLLELDCPVGPATGPATGAVPPLLPAVARLPIGADVVELRPYAHPLDHAIPGLAPQPFHLGLALMTPRGRARAADPPDGVRVDLSAEPDPHDAEVLARAEGWVREALGITGPAHPGTSQHLSGGAAPGRVVDDSGAVLGVEGLSVADASVLPAAPAVGPYLTVLAIAEALAGRRA